MLSKILVYVRPIIIALILSPPSFAQEAHDSIQQQVRRKWVDINYAGDTLTGHRLDIFLPSSGTSPYPVIVCIAGSAFFSNDSKERAFRIGSPLLKEGFAIVAVNHRSSRTAIFPSQINDIKGVIRFLRANALAYELDTAFIGITGDSSGGYLAAMLGTSGGVRYYSYGHKRVDLEGSIGGNTALSSRVDAVVDWYGPTDFQKMDSCGSEMNHDAADSPESILIGGPIQKNDDLCILANPMTYIDAGDPPFLILHGDADPLVPHCQSQLLHEALTKNRVDNELIIVPDGGHGKGMWLDKYIDRMMSFFVEVRKKKMAKK